MSKKTPVNKKAPGVLAIRAGWMGNPSEKNMVLNEMDYTFVPSPATQLSNHDSRFRHFSAALRHIRHGRSKVLSCPVPRALRKGCHSSSAWSTSSEENASDSEELLDLSHQLFLRRMARENSLSANDSASTSSDSVRNNALSVTYPCKDALWQNGFYF
jgi:hypothetical protein